MLLAFSSVNGIIQALDKIFKAAVRDSELLSESEFSELISLIGEISSIEDTLNFYLSPIPTIELYQMHEIACKAFALLKSSVNLKDRSPRLNDISKEINNLEKLLHSLTPEMTLALTVLLELDTHAARERTLSLRYKDQKDYLVYTEKRTTLSEKSFQLINDKITLNEFVIFVKSLEISVNRWADVTGTDALIKMNELIEELILAVDVKDILDATHV